LAHILVVGIFLCADDQQPVRTVLLKYYDLKNISPNLLSLLRKHSPEGDEAKKLDSLLADGVCHMSAVLFLFTQSCRCTFGFERADG